MAQIELPLGQELNRERSGIPVLITHRPETRPGSESVHILDERTRTRDGRDGSAQTKE
jgi:hypothetical protein